MKKLGNYLLSAVVAIAALFILTYSLIAYTLLKSRIVSVIIKTLCTYLSVLVLEIWADQPILGWALGVRSTPQVEAAFLAMLAGFAFVGLEALRWLCKFNNDSYHRARSEKYAHIVKLRRVDFQEKARKRAQRAQPKNFFFVFGRR